MGFWKVLPMLLVGAKSQPIYFFKNRVQYFLTKYIFFLQDPVAPAIGENPIIDLGVTGSEYHGTVSTVLNKKTEQCAPGCASQLPTAETT